MIGHHGAQVGGLIASGYRLVTIYGSRFYAHRLAFLYMLGRWPIGEVDHINGAPDDNRWENLREATHQENGRNVKTAKNNTSGVKGVYWAKDKRKWTAQITISRKTYHLGRFDTIEAAKACREAKTAEVFGEFARQ